MWRGVVFRRRSSELFDYIIFFGYYEYIMKFSINTIQSYIQEPLSSAGELEHLFTFHLCEVEGLESLPDGDTLIDLNILPNRAHDMLGHYGVARELAGQLGLTLKPLLVGSDYSNEEGLVVKIDISTDKCSRYMARRIDGVAVGDSDEATKSFLAKLGQRSINNVVDATNQVMWLTGQPTHIFDADKVTGGITVRMAHLGEVITLLDGTEMKLDESVMVIADDIAVLAIAGIKGGKHAEVDIHTKNIILEVANFDASTIRKTAQKLGLRTDASYRFERDISPSMCLDAMNLLTDLIGVRGGAGQSVGVITDVWPAPQAPTVIEFALAEVIRVAGSILSNADITNILQRYGFAYVEREDNFSVTIPLWRLDLTGRHDMIEEIIRIRGLEYIEPVTPPVLNIVENRFHNLVQYIRNRMLADGFSEVMTYSFRDSGESRVLASAGDKSYLRSNITDGFVESLNRNVNNRDLLGVDEVRQFEIGTVFGKDTESTHLCFGIKSVKKSKSILVLWQDLFLTLGIDGKATETLISKAKPFKQTDSTIEIDLGEFFDVLDFEISGRSSDLDGATEETIAPFVEWSKYPYITRDIAVWVPESQDSKELENVYSTLGGELMIRAPRLLDSFTKEGRTSYAYRLVFQSPSRTLADSDVAEITGRIYSALQDSGFEVR